MFAVEVKDLSKVFKRYQKPLHMLLEAFSKKRYHEPFVALESVSFNVPFGQVLGIVGENGAGKSTLLKILAGTLSPTTGDVIIRGKTAALLELGAGFHPEFTGRQNIYLNASLLGLSQEEIRSKEADIIAFSELDDFIDKPVKTYSSGMYVRLAFSIATVVDPDVLIIDEALAVGDQHFQKKCIDRMVQFCKSGKTVIFCSHNLYQINLLCQKALWLHHGKIKLMGKAEDITRAYEDYSLEKDKRYKEETLEQIKGQNDNKPPDCVILEVWAENGNGRPIPDEISPHQDLTLKMKIKAIKDVDVHFGFAILRSDDLLCFCALTSFDNLGVRHLKAGEVIQVESQIKNFSLLNGTYRIIGGILDPSGLYLHHYIDSKPFTVKSSRQMVGLVDFAREWRIS